MASTVSSSYPVAAALFERALRSIPGGNARAAMTVGPHPPFARSAAGCRITDVDGHVVIDLLNNFTSLLHGHARPELIEAATEAMALGTIYGMPTEAEVAFAELLKERIPSTDRWRFSNSGSEAVMGAVRLARGFTGRDLIVRFEGCYHGMYDAVALEARGVSTGVAGDVVVVPPQDADALVAALDRYDGRIAGVLMDPMPSRAGLVPSPPAFVQRVREETERRGILLIFDEVITLRIAAGGMQSVYGVRPDLTATAKIIGGGFPVGAVGGRGDVMDISDARRPDKLALGGTFSGNLVTMRAGMRTLELMTDAEYVRINGYGDRLRAALAEQGWTVRGHGSLARIELGGSSERWWRLYDEGVLISPGGLTCTSTAMTDDDIDEVIAAFGRVADQEGRP